MNQRKRCALVGTGGRAVTFLDAIVDTHKDHAELVGICDISPTRMKWHNDRLAHRYHAAPAPTYPAQDFDNMVRQTRPDVVIVTSMDCTHHAYIVRAMELGCDAISEKPMTTDAAKCRAILDAIERTGRNLRVTFNYRYTPAVTQVKKLIMEGTIGTPTSVDLSWALNTSHGADYFRRWHREKDKSGGLLVHKATHHFDIVNWWIDSYPKTVFALGDLKFYGRKNAEARGEHYSYDRYTGVAEARDDPFALRLDKDVHKPEDLYGPASARGLYLNAEKDSGYVRDRNVFGDNITIEDTMAVMVRYRSNVILNYSLIAYCPWEGMRAAVNGTRGRVEMVETWGSHIIAGQDDKTLASEQAKGHQKHVRVFPMFGVAYDVPVPEAKGSHGGGDPILLEQIFSPDAPHDPYGRAASHFDGTASILVGVSANESIATGKPINCDDLVPLLEKDASGVTAHCGMT